MTEGRRIKVEAKDKRRVVVDDETARAAGEAQADGDSATADAVATGEETAPPSAEGEGSGAVDGGEQSDLLDDLRRLQADFDNYRKRMMREQTEISKRTSARVLERLLPVLDSFERAVDHGEGGEGIALVFKEFKSTLEAEGLEEIEAEGVPFDPRVHEAMSMVEDEKVSEQVCRTVVRRGYRAGDTLLRAAMVVVAEPPSAGTGATTGDSPDESARGAETEAGGA